MNVYIHISWKHTPIQRSRLHNEISWLLPNSFIRTNLWTWTFTFTFHTEHTPIQTSRLHNKMSWLFPHSFIHTNSWTWAFTCSFYTKHTPIQTSRLHKKMSWLLPPFTTPFPSLYMCMYAWIRSYALDEIPDQTSFVGYTYTPLFLYV